ncbi:NDR1/HIN1-like protein 13 [Cardamine amara subsp. amara]|uniref:NDR1/HIN1-like protein 13 n=1 Tax=Cardamine amara subsp. amara TaxID=228776 RepID=A0ABD1ABT5_CARAN
MAGVNTQKMTGEINSGEFVTNKVVHRTMRPSIDTNDSTSSRYSIDSQKPRLRPPPGTYVIEIPKEVIFREPPPENAQRYECLSRQKPNRSGCRRCCCYSLAVVLLLFVLVTLVAGIIYLVYQPQKPRFSVTGVSVAGINLTSSSPVTPVIKIKVRSQNHNGKVGFIYGKGNEAELFYDGIKLGNGEFTAFEQPVKNVTVMRTVLKRSSIQLTSSSREELEELQKKGKVPFVFGMEAPFKFKIGIITTWKMTVTVYCKVTLDKLTASATVVTENCDTGLSLL